MFSDKMTQFRVDKSDIFKTIYKLAEILEQRK